MSKDGVTSSYLTSPDGYRIQKTLRAPARLSGVGLHSGITTSLTLHPAGVDHGIVFLRKAGKKLVHIPAHYDSVVATQLATSLGMSEAPDVRVGTVEHLMAALYGMGITNLLIELSGPEIPILDGSAFPFLEAILDAGVEFQHYTTKTLKILKPIKVFEGGAVCELLPRERLRLTTSIEFPHPSIGVQTYAVELTPYVFQAEISTARTFGFLKDVDKLKRHQLALGASLKNVLAFSETDVANPEGMRYPDECVRHKLLDALGDLALCGCWIQGELVSYRGGHSMHLLLLKTLKESRHHWELLPSEPTRTSAAARVGVFPVAQYE